MFSFIRSILACTHMRAYTNEMYFKNIRNQFSLLWSHNNEESWWYGFSPKASRLDTQEDVFQFECKNRKNQSILLPVSQCEVRLEEFPFIWKSINLLLYLSLNWLDEATHKGRAISYTQSCHLYVQVIQKHTYRNTHNNIWLNNSLVAS